MASLPGEAGGGSPEFDIDALAVEPPYYDPEEIAEEAIWPFVEQLWGEDWRTHAIVGQQLQIPKVSTLESGEMYSVCISANQSLDLDDEADGSPYTSTAEICIEQFLSDPARTAIVEKVSEQRSEEFEAFDLGTLIVKNCVSYAFDTSGDFDIDPYHVIEEPYEGHHLWYSTSGIEGESDEGELIHEEVRLRDHDIDCLIRAFRILEAPEDLVKTLELLKAQASIDPA